MYTLSLYYSYETFSLFPILTTNELHKSKGHIAYECLLVSAMHTL